MLPLQTSVREEDVQLSERTLTVLPAELLSNQRDRVDQCAASMPPAVENKLRMRKSYDACCQLRSYGRRFSVKKDRP